MFLDSLEPVSAELRSGAAEQVQATRGVAVKLRRLDARARARLHKGACKGCTRLYEYDDIDTPRAAKLGLFVYDCDDGWPVPYTLVERPMTPVKVAQLPAELRAAAQQVKYRFCFGEAPYVQPAEHGDVVTWGSNVFLSADGRTLRALKGEEKSAAVTTPGDFGLEHGVFDPTPLKYVDRPPPRWVPPAPEAPAPATAKAAKKKPAAKTKPAAKRPAAKQKKKKKR
jgi:hypothetical protein